MARRGRDKVPITDRVTFMGVLAESPPIVLSDIPLDITSATWVRTLAARGPLRSAVQVALPASFVARLDRVVIVGEGGTGKSTLLKQMLALSAGEGRIPVWLPLARLPTEGVLTITTLIEQLVEQARTQLGVEEVNRSFFEKAACDGLLAIGFDALDECGSLARRQKVRGLILEVAREWKGCRIFVTSRSDALRETPLPMFSDSSKANDDKRDPFLGLTPLPFTRDDVTPFLEAAFDDGEQLAQQLLARTGIEALLETPLTLMLVGLVARTSEGFLPATRTPLFARCLDTVVDTWEDAKGMPVVDGLDRHQRLDVLRRLGWEAQRSEEDVLDARAAGAALLPALGNPARAKAAVDGLARRNLLLRAETAGQGALDVRSIRFAHPQFREYLAGAHLAEQFALDATAAAAAMAPYWLDSGWLEVLRFGIATLEDDPELRDLFPARRARSAGSVRRSAASARTAGGPTTGAPAGGRRRACRGLGRVPRESVA